MQIICLRCWPLDHTTRPGTLDGQCGQNYPADLLKIQQQKTERRKRTHKTRNGRTLRWHNKISGGLRKVCPPSPLLRRITKIICLFPIVFFFFKYGIITYRAVIIEEHLLSRFSSFLGWGEKTQKKYGKSDVNQGNWQSLKKSDTNHKRRYRGEGMQ